jgi:hypothetical protein
MPKPPALSIVKADLDSPASRAATLQAQAVYAANQHVADTLAHMHETAHALHLIANGGDAYLIGVRETARRLVTVLVREAESIQGTMERNNR